MGDIIDVVVAGSICLDITPQMFSDGRSIEEIFRPGRLVNVGPAVIGTGGPVSNTGLALLRLGLSVKLMGKCGDDMLGRALIETIKAEAPGAEAGMKVVAGESTSYTVVICPPGVDRMFLHCTGANDTFDSKDVDPETVGAARLFHFGYPPLMARTYANGGRELVRIMREAKARGATTSLDLTYPDPAGPEGKADWAGILAAALPHVDIFTPSVEELTFMLRRPTLEKLSARAGSGDILEHIEGDLLCDLGEKCIEAGAAVVLIKCGHLGVYLRTAGMGRLEALGRAKPGDPADWTNRELFEPSYKVDKVVSATGAGDCAIAGFLAAYLRGCGVSDALRYACAVGAQNLRATDTISGIMDWDRTVEQVASRPARNDVSITLNRWRYDESAEHYAGPRDGKAL